MTEEIKILTEQIKTLTEQNKSLLEKFEELKKNMISKLDKKLNVKTLQGRVINIYVDPSDKIKSLKSQIQLKETIPLEQQVLLLGNKEMNDDSTVGDYDLKDNSTIILVKKNDECLSFLSDFEKSFMVDSLEKKVEKKLGDRLYSARKDGDSASTFHQKCDNQGPLLYVIKTTQNYNFGIYVSKPIFSDGQTRTDSLQMVICPYKNFAVKSLNDRATYHCNSGSGPQFHCMQINAPFLSSSCTDINSCNDFNLPSYPSGNSSYNISELEVYSLLSL